MAVQTCALSGCNKPPWPSVGCTTPHLTCGNLHHLLLMASRFDPALPSPYIAVLNRNTAGLCALLSCKKQPYPGHPWCSRRHYLLWLADFTASLRPEQICKLPDCIRHVFVDDNAPPSEFCGWEHEQKFVMLSALNQRHQEEALPEMATHPPEPPSPAPSIESECGLVPSLSSRMHSLKQFAQSGIIPPKNIRIVEDFYEKHPWDVFTEGHACLLIACLKFNGKGSRKLTTKEQYHWKQSGPRAKKSKLYTAKYYTYVKMKRKGKEVEEEEHAEISCSYYSMKEYTMEGVQGHSLIQLVKPRKEQPAPPLVEVHNACFQDSSSDDIMDLCHVDDTDIFRELQLSPITHLPQVCSTLHSHL